jgi:hypothetical protein
LTNCDPATKSLLAAKSGSIYDKALVNPDRNNFSPRVGIAYSPTARTVVRTGYGVKRIENLERLVEPTDPGHPGLIQRQPAAPADILGAQVVEA